MNLQEFYNKYSNIIVSIYEFGSRLLGLNSDTSDRDIRVYIKRENYSKYCIILKKELKILGYDAFIHIDDEYIGPTLYNYQFYYKKLLCGQDLDLDYNLIDNTENIENTLKVIKDQFKTINRFWKHKSWYHIYITLYIIKNKTYEINNILETARLIKSGEMTDAIHKDILNAFSELAEVYLNK